MATFRSRYREAQDLARRLAEPNRRKERAETTEPEGVAGPLFETEGERQRREYHEDQARHFAEIAAYQRQSVKERLEIGFRHWFAMEVGGRWRAPFTEQGLRSETLNSIAARYFVTCVHKAGALRSSMDKATLAVQTRSKLLSLDYPYIEANRKVMSVMRIDCDRVFDSPGQCLAALRELVGDRIPCLPHLITGDLLPDGRYSRPHFYFLLPSGHGVWNDPGDPRCRMDIVRFFHAVSMGLVSALLEIGADPCAPALTLRGKNPLSPYWYTLCPNDTVWPTLSDYAGWVDMSASREKLVRQASALQTGSGIGSNELFNVMQKQAFAVLRQWHFAANPRGRGERGRIADDLHQELAAFLAKTGCGHLTKTQADLLVAKVADYAAGAWDVSKVETSAKMRHRLLHITEGMTTVSKRQAAGAAYAAGVKSARALEALTDAYVRLSEEGRPVTQAAVAALAGVHRRTAVRRWSDVLEAVGASEAGCDNRCIDKKAGTSPAYPRPVDAVDPSGTESGSHGRSNDDGSIVYLKPIPSGGTRDLQISQTAPQTDVATVNGHPDPVQLSQDDDDDDMAEIEAQEAWLASQDIVIPSDAPEPDEDWFEERKRAA
jgi:hypothetical protein